MSWTLDDIDLRGYGVGVTKTSGLLDMPRLQDEPADWLDADGPDYWQDAGKYADREILLYCWIAARPVDELTGYENFAAKVAAFYAAITAPGTRSLKYNGTEVAAVYVQNRVEMVRKTAYVSSLQVGMFTLRLTVAGDPDYELISILDKSSTAVKEVIKTKNLVVSKTLQGEEYATCTCETSTPLTSGMYDWIRVNTDGTNLDAFLLTSTPQVRKESTNKYVYDLRFEGITLHFKQMKFVLFGQSEFDFYGDLAEVAALICESVDRFVWFGNDRFTIGSCAATVKKLHNFANEDCLAALQRMCSEYGMEFRFERQPDTRYKIYISQFESKANPVELEYGKGNTLYQISRGAMDASKLCTVLWAFGAAKNIKAGYRNGMKRLSFDGNPLKANEASYGTWEHTVNFDDIFPNRSALVTGYLQVLPEDLTAAEKEVHPNGIFVVGDSTLDFDLNDYLLGGLTAKIAMKTGDLAGYQFDILRYDHTNKHIHIIRVEDETIGPLPNATLQIAAGDEYTLVDMDQPVTYVEAAETALEEKAQEYIDQWSIPQYEYSVKTNPAWFAANPGSGFNVGDILTITDTNLGISSSHRITTLGFNYNTKIYDLTLSNFKKPTKRQQTEFRLQVIERALFANRKEETETIKDEKITTGELRRTLLDPDEKLRVDKIVENQTIDARMIGLDAKTSPVVLTDAWFETHVGGNVEAAKQYAGLITIKNYEGINRYEAQKKIDNEEEYNPSRTWVIPETNFSSLDPAKNFNIYYKLDLTPASTTATVIVDERHIDPKEQIKDGLWILPVGNITKDIEEAEE